MITISRARDLDSKGDMIGRLENYILNGKEGISKPVISQSI